MKPCIQLEPRFDATRLKTELRHIEEHPWDPIYVPEFFDGEWTAIALIARDGATQSDRLKGGAGTYRKTRILTELPYMESVLDTLPGKKLRARLMRLEPGSVIKEHRDGGGGWSSGHLRLHIPVQTNDDVHFLLNQKRVVMQEGELWYANVMLPHMVRNDGECARVHMVVDIVLDKDLAALFPPESLSDRALRWGYRHGFHRRLEKLSRTRVGRIGQRLLGLRYVPTHRPKS